MCHEYEELFWYYWSLKGKFGESYKEKPVCDFWQVPELRYDGRDRTIEEINNSITFEEAKNAIEQFRTIWERIVLSIYNKMGVDAIYRYAGRREEEFPHKKYFKENITDEEILSLPPLPYVENPQYRHGDERLYNLLDVSRYSMLTRILINTELSKGFSYLIHYGTLKREMHNLGYAVSRDGIHESEIQEREKAKKAHEEDVIKYPWKYHDNKYVNSDKNLWDKMK